MTRREEPLLDLAPDLEGQEIKFIADAMLGRLARWLRFLGFDTLYFPGIHDAQLVRIAREQNRTILTRDTRLVRMRGLTDYLLVESDHPYQQLLETVGTFKPLRFRPWSRCVACNGALEEVSDKAAVRESVPEFVFLHTDRFRRCTSCGRVYWQGTHTKKFRNDICKILGVDAAGGERIK